LLWGRGLATFASGDLEEATRPFAKAKASPAPRRHTLRRTRCSVKLSRHARSLRAGAIHLDGTSHAPDPRAQRAGKPPIIDVITAGSATSTTLLTDLLVQRLCQLGWVVGRDVVVEYRYAEASIDHAGEALPSSPA
jgi:hypothetical protein